MSLIAYLSVFNSVQLFCYNALLPRGWYFFQRIFISFYVLTHIFNFLTLVL